MTEGLTTEIYRSPVPIYSTMLRPAAEAVSDPMRELIEDLWPELL
jgi:hypothetical protein